VYIFSDIKVKYIMYTKINNDYLKGKWKANITHERKSGKEIVSANIN
jgi:hypothetical protein